jgi:hypothetical protein
MKTKIKFSDLPVLIKNDRRYQIAVVLIILVILWPMLDPTKPVQRVQSKAPEAATGTGKTPENELGSDLVTAFKQDLTNMDARVGNIEKSVEEQGQNLKGFESRTAEIFKKVLERIVENEGQGGTGAGNVTPRDINGPDGQVTSLDSEKLEKFGDSEEDKGIAAPPAPAKYAIIGAGDSVRVKLLAGVNAPTDGTPYPVVFKLDGDVLGPDGSTLPLGEARLIAAAQGSLTDSRALFRLTSLNIRLPNGRRKIIGVDGWVVGEDGIRGMSGVLIDPIGKAIAGAGMAGALQGLGEGIAAGQTTTTNSFGQTQTFVSGDVGKIAAGRGLAGAADAWSGIIQDRLDQLVPVVQVLSGRESTAVFAKSVTIPDLYEALEEEDSNFQFASMD